jgi:hypothetical protein
MDSAVWSWWLKICSQAPETIFQLHLYVLETIFEILVPPNEIKN